MFFYLIINLFFTTKIELSIEEIPFYGGFFFTLIVAYFFIKLSKKFKFILKILTSNIILQSCAAIFEFAYNNIAKFSYHGN